MSAVRALAVAGAAQGVVLVLAAIVWLVPLVATVDHEALLPFALRLPL